MGSWSPPEGFLPTIVGPPTAGEERAKRRAEVENALSPIHVSRPKGELSIEGYTLDSTATGLSFYQRRTCPLSRTLFSCPLC